MVEVISRVGVRPEHEPLVQLLEQLTYRPGWRFSILEDQLVIRATVIDTDNPSQEIPLQFGVGLPSMVPPDFPWRRWLFDQILTVEKHEAAEFFKIDGVKVFDPHG